MPAEQKSDRVCRYSTIVHIVRYCKYKTQRPACPLYVRVHVCSRPGSAEDVSVLLLFHASADSSSRLLARTVSALAESSDRLAVGVARGGLGRTRRIVHSICDWSSAQHRHTDADGYWCRQCSRFVRHIPAPPALLSGAAGHARRQMGCVSVQTGSSPGVDGVESSSPLWTHGSCMYATSTCRASSPSNCHQTA